MASYDSDSSGGEDNDFTETNVLLGYASKEASDDTISYLGGRPVSLQCFHFTWNANPSFTTIIQYTITNLQIPVLDRPLYPAIRRPRKMQSLQRPDGSAVATKRRPPRILSWPRKKTIRPDMQEEDVPAQGGEREGYTWG